MPNADTKRTKSLVSVVITSRNEERHIENCFKSIKNQSYLTNLCLPRRSEATLRDNRLPNLCNPKFSNRCNHSLNNHRNQAVRPCKDSILLQKRSGIDNLMAL